MPPAFNLSQDQTLQFNLCKLSSKLTWKNQFHVSIRVFLFAKLRVAYATQRRPPTPNAHTYRLLIFKDDIILISGEITPEGIKDLVLTLTVTEKEDANNQIMKVGVYRIFQHEGIARRETLY